MNNLISWVKRTICCLLSGRGGSQKAREETWGISEPNLPGDEQGMQRWQWGFPGEARPKSLLEQGGSGTGTTGPFSMEKGAREGRKGEENSN